MGCTVQFGGRVGALVAVGKMRHWEVEVAADRDEMPEHRFLADETHWEGRG